MEGPQIRIPLQSLRQADGDTGLESLVKICIENMAERYQIDARFLLHLTDEVVDKVKEEIRRFRPEQRTFRGVVDSYPPPHVNNLSIQIELPTLGRIGVAEWNSSINV